MKQSFTFGRPMRNEADTRADLIDPRLNQAGWGSDACQDYREFGLQWPINGRWSS